jgi:hypothetical protein
MKAQIMVDVVPISTIHIPNLLHQNNIGLPMQELQISKQK